MRRLIAKTGLITALLLCAQMASAATVYIEEFQRNSNVTYQVALAVPGIAKQTVAITGSSVQSAAFNAATMIIRVHADAICSIEIGGVSPTATVTSMRFAANQTEYFIVNPGDKLAVITNT